MLARFPGRLGSRHGSVTGWTGAGGSPGTANHRPSRAGVASGSWDKGTERMDPESCGLEDTIPRGAQAAHGAERSLRRIPAGFAPLLLKPRCKFFPKANVGTCSRGCSFRFPREEAGGGWREGCDVCSSITLGSRRGAPGAEFGRQPGGARGAGRMPHHAFISPS